SGKPRQVLSICRRDALKDPSPNSGWSECVYAAILGVQLGGINTYGGIVKEKPLLGEAVNPITPEKIEQALRLTRYCCLLWLAIALIILELYY
ncbi:MAG: cobalamin biosynthesis protein, partial [Xenococcaceae cyanobacterium]